MVQTSDLWQTAYLLSEGYWLDKLEVRKRDGKREFTFSIGGLEVETAARRFQDGAQPSSGARVTKAWCRKQFDRRWDERLRAADEVELQEERRSGNETAILS